MRIQRLDESSKKNLLEDLLKRSPNQYIEYEERVSAILKSVKDNKDKAVFDYTKQFDGVEISADTIRVTEAEIEEAYEKVDASLVEIIRKAKENIKNEKKYCISSCMRNGVSSCSMRTAACYNRCRHNIRTE